MIIMMVGRQTGPLITSLNVNGSIALFAPGGRPSELTRAARRRADSRALGAVTMPAVAEYLNPRCRSANDCRGSIHCLALTLDEKSRVDV